MKTFQQSIFHVGELTRFEQETLEFTVDIQTLQMGVNQVQDFFVSVDSNRDVDWVVSRECDHERGLLSLRADGQTAACPLHGWTLDFETLEYTNVKCVKEKVPFSVDGQNLTLAYKKYGLKLPDELRNDGGSGVDYAWYYGSSAGVTVDLAAGDGRRWRGGRRYADKHRECCRLASR